MYRTSTVSTTFDRSVLLARSLPSSYVAGTTNIAPYVQTVVDSIETGGRASIVLPAGTHVWDSPVYLDAATRDLTYEIQGHGRGTVLQLGAGLNGTYALFVNQNSSGVRAIESPRMPRLRFSDMYVTKTDAAVNPSLAYLDMAVVDMERVRFKSIYRAATAISYTDIQRFRMIGWETPVTGGVMYYNHSNGDGLVVEQVSANKDAAVVDLDGCNGGIISGAIGGTYSFYDCDAIEVIAPHMDHKSETGYASVPSFNISSSRVTFRGGWDHVGTLTPVFSISDTSSTKHSEVTWDGYTFGFRPHTPDKLRQPHIHIAAVQSPTKLRFRRCTGRLFPENSTNRYSVGPKISSAVAEVQAAFDYNPTGPLEDSDLILTESGWQFTGAPPRRGRTMPILADPTANATAVTTVVGDFGAGVGVAHYYRVAVIQDVKRSIHTARSAQQTATPAAGQSVNVAITNARQTPVYIRIWRGTVSNTYDRYADVPISGYTGNLFDTGPAISGFPWITTGVPTSWTTSTSMVGEIIGNSARFHGPAVPTEGTWAQGDQVWNSAPSAGGVLGWVCTVGGTPGTWKTVGTVAA